jgi:hypothetical protein
VVFLFELAGFILIQNAESPPHRKHASKIMEKHHFPTTLYPTSYNRFWNRFLLKPWVDDWVSLQPYKPGVLFHLKPPSPKSLETLLTCLLRYNEKRWSCDAPSHSLKYKEHEMLPFRDTPQKCPVRPYLRSFNAFDQEFLVILTSLGREVDLVNFVKERSRRALPMKQFPLYPSAPCRINVDFPEPGGPATSQAACGIYSGDVLFFPRRVNVRWSGLSYCIKFM